MDDTHNLLAVGRLVKSKNFDSLIEAIPLVKHKVKLKIIGQGEEFGNLHQMVDQRKYSNVRIARFMNHKKLMAEYRKADLFILPSVVEGFGLVVAEAMSCGTPVLVSDNEGIAKELPELWRISNPPNAENIAKAIDSMIILMRNYPNGLKEEIKKEMEKFDSVNVVPKIVDMYTEMIK